MILGKLIRGSSIIILLLLFIIAGCCPTIVVLKDAALYSCGTNTIYLSGWWTNVADKSAIQADPAGGYQFAYWVDEDGNACHGDPGRNGQVGPAVINAYKPSLYDMAINQSSITEEQLKSFQEIPVSFDNYSGSGLHFVQFYNKYFRIRSDGKTHNTDETISIPTVTVIGSKACIAPVAFHLIQTLFFPASFLQDPLTQDPIRCKVRAFPSDATMSEEDRKEYDVMNLPHGTEIFDVT